jgi:hypothetical protein
MKLAIILRLILAIAGYIMAIIYVLFGMKRGLNWKAFSIRNFVTGFPDFNKSTGAELILYGVIMFLFAVILTYFLKP